MTVEESTSISDGAFAMLCELVAERIGVQLDGKQYLAESRLAPLLQSFPAVNINQLVMSAATDERVASAVVEAMTTNETSFFRDGHPFTTLAEVVLPDIFRRREGERVQIWNAACSSGQESYTLAMLINEHLPDRAMPSSVNILSTDVSTRMVQRTEEAAYSQFEVARGLSQDLVDRYFEPHGRHWLAGPKLRSIVTARRHNLLGNWGLIPPSDLVLLRNVLIYFPVEKKQAILSQIRTKVLKPGGYLLLGSSETTVGIDPGYEARKIGMSTFYVTAGP